MSYGILLLRLVLGLTVAGHGAQQLFGYFGGRGLRGTGTSFGRLGFRSPTLVAFAAGLGQVAGGLLLAAGYLTPLAALAIAVVMLSAIAAVHWRNGFWNANGGYEYNLLIGSAAIALAATGAGRFSVDRLLGWDDNISGLWWAVGVLALGLLVSGLMLALGRRRDARVGMSSATTDAALRQAA